MTGSLLMSIADLHHVQQNVIDGNTDHVPNLIARGRPQLFRSNTTKTPLPAARARTYANTPADQDTMNWSFENLLFQGQRILSRAPMGSVD
jgi:hypothetical protein